MLVKQCNVMVLLLQNVTCCQLFSMANNAQPVLAGGGGQRNNKQILSMNINSIRLF